MTPAAIRILDTLQVVNRFGQCRLALGSNTQRPALHDDELGRRGRAWPSRGRNARIAPLVETRVRDGKLVRRLRQRRQHRHHQLDLVRAGHAARAQQRMHLVGQRLAIAARIVEIVQRQHLGVPAARFRLGFHHLGQGAFAAALQTGQAENVRPARAGDTAGVLVQQVAGKGLVLRAAVRRHHGVRPGLHAAAVAIRQTPHMIRSRQFAITSPAWAIRDR